MTHYVKNLIDMLDRLIAKNVYVNIGVIQQSYFAKSQ